MKAPSVFEDAELLMSSSQHRQHKRMDGPFLTSRPNASQKGHPFFIAILALNVSSCVLWEDLRREASRCISVSAGGREASPRENTGPGIVYKCRRSDRIGIFFVSNQGAGVPLLPESSPEAAIGSQVALVLSSSLTQSLLRSQGGPQLPSPTKAFRVLGQTATFLERP